MRRHPAGAIGRLLLQRLYGTPLCRLGMPIGIRATDELTAQLAALSDRTIPERYSAAWAG